jgi:hypothetical protein
VADGQEPIAHDLSLCDGRGCRFDLWIPVLRHHKRYFWIPVSVSGSYFWMMLIGRNRLGLFLFILSLFGFSCLSSLGVFANERLLFMRERYVTSRISAYSDQEY